MYKQLSTSVMNLYLNGTLRRISGDMESLDGIFKRKAMRDQGADINKPTSDKTDCFGILG
jgi:hypothetical protein